MKYINFTEDTSCPNIILGDKWTDLDLWSMFDGEPVRISSAIDLPNLTKEVNAYKSTSEARRAGRTGDIPKGFSNKLKLSKKIYVWIFNPDF